MSLQWLVQNGVPRIGSDSGDDSINLPFLRGLLSPVVFAESRALSMGPRRFPSMPFACVFPLLAALNGMTQRSRDAATAARNALWSVRVWSPLNLVWAMMRLPCRSMTKECHFCLRGARFVLLVS